MSIGILALDSLNAEPSAAVVFAGEAEEDVVFWLDDGCAWTATVRYC